MAAAERVPATLHVPTPGDFRELAVLQTAAFAEKLVCVGATENRQEVHDVYSTYHRKHPAKLQHCRVLRANGKIVGACQLQAQGDPGDLTFPGGLRHKVDPGEVYVEWIACHPDHLGQGYGSMLLRWADDFSRRELGATHMTLAVMAANKGAVRLYERKGYIIQPDTHMSACGGFCRSCFIFCFLGCRYWSVHFMVKDLKEEPTAPALPAPGSAAPKEPIQVAAAGST